MGEKTKVIVVGAGIVGPILAIFLKMKGYEPVIYERTDQLSDAGLSMVLQPNGLRVLSLIPGLLDKIVGIRLEKTVHRSVVPEDEAVLVQYDMSALSALTGFGLIGVMRSTFNRTIIKAAEDFGVKIVWGHQLVALRQEGENVEVTFSNGSTDTASFVFGCDGLHSNTRICLFGEQPASFTGLTQTGGVSPTPKILQQYPHLGHIYGNGSHMIVVTVSDTHTSWAITVREPETKEDWRAMGEQRQKRFKEGPFSQWGFGAGEMVKTAEKIVKYGLYDRPDLTTWHKGRVALVGDAAHPMSPHLGQGVNQAFEDVYHLVHFLTRNNPSALPPSADVLSSAFLEYEELRIPRMSRLVREARQKGESWVLQGVEACKTRNNYLRKYWNNEKAVMPDVKDMFLQPFIERAKI